MKKSNASKVISILYVVALYLLPIIFIGGSFLSDYIKTISSVDLGGVVFALAIINILAICIIGTLNIIFALVNALTNDDTPYKRTVILKIILIPFYVLNFFFWACLIGGTLNPFLFLTSIPIAIIGISTTYLIMLTTSINNLVYFFRNILKIKKMNLGVAITSIVFHFFFTLDVIGSIMILIEDNKLKKKENLN